MLNKDMIFNIVFLFIGVMIVGVLFENDKDSILEARFGDIMLLEFEFILEVIGLFIVIKIILLFI